MKIRGQRECQDCGTQWSYYETGDVACPDCDSLRSRGLDEPTEHTDTPLSLDLSPSRALVEPEGLHAALDDAVERCREYRRRTGFIHTGTLKPLSDTYLAATELVYAAREFTRAMQTSEEEELYVVTLLRGADENQRPLPDEVPPSMRTARGLAYATAIDDYRRDLSTLDNGPDSMAQRILATVASHVRRVEALDGDVPIETTEQLVRTIQDVAAYVRTGEETSLATARDRLDRLD